MPEEEVPEIELKPPQILGKKEVEKVEEIKPPTLKAKGTRIEEVVDKLAADKISKEKAKKELKGLI